MRGGMQDAVFRRQHINAGQACHRDGAAAQLGGIRVVACGVGQDRVMHVDHGGALDVLQRGDLVHPAAVVALVVLRQAGGVPACQHECGLGLRQPLARHQNIDVIEQSPRRSGQVGGDVGRALEHDQRTVEIGQRSAKLSAVPSAPPCAACRPAFRRHRNASAPPLVLRPSTRAGESGAPDVPAVRPRVPAAPACPTRSRKSG